MTDYPTISLRGAAVPIRLAKLRMVSTNEGAQYEFEKTPDGALVLEELGLLMDINVLAQYEERYGSLEAWQIALTTKPYTTVRDSIAMCIGRDAATTGKAMLATETKTYMASVGAAFAIANGVDPTRAMEIVAKADQIDVNKDLDEMLDDVRAATTQATPTASPSPLGSVPGPAPAEPTESSGG